MEGNIMDKPRWINEIPRPVQINEKVKITDEMKKEAKAFEKAIKSGDIDKLFNKKV